MRRVLRMVKNLILVTTFLLITSGPVHALIWTINATALSQNVESFEFTVDDVNNDDIIELWTSNGLAGTDQLLTDVQPFQYWSIFQLINLVGTPYEVISKVGGGELSFQDQVYGNTADAGYYTWTFAATVFGSPTYIGADDSQWSYSASAYSVSESPVPEPATMLLFGIGLLGMAGINRKKIR